MKIRIKNWNVFEKENSIYFTRDSNISNEIEVLAQLCKKKEHYYLCLIDFYKYKVLSMVKRSYNVELIDSSIPSDRFYCEGKKYVYRDDEDGDVIKETLKDIIAPKWMIDDESFFLLVGYSNRMAIKLYEMH